MESKRSASGKVKNTQQQAERLSELRDFQQVLIALITPWQGLSDALGIEVEGHVEVLQSLFETDEISEYERIIGVSLYNFFTVFKNLKGLDEEQMAAIEELEKPFECLLKMVNVSMEFDDGKETPKGSPTLSSGTTEIALFKTLSPALAAVITELTPQLKQMSLLSHHSEEGAGGVRTRQSYSPMSPISPLASTFLSPPFFPLESGSPSKKQRGSLAYGFYQPQNSGEELLKNQQHLIAYIRNIVLEKGTRSLKFKDQIIDIIHCPRCEKKPPQMLQELKALVQAVDHNMWRSSRLNRLRSAILMLEDINDLPQIETAVRYLKNDKKTQGHDPVKGGVSEQCVMM
jgi:hypothetical protein